MNKSALSQLIEQNLSTREIAKVLEKSQTNVRFWLKRFELKTKITDGTINHKVCPACKIEKSYSEFHKRKSGVCAPYCKSCTNKQTNDRKILLKKKCVELKGGKCCRCGYNKYIGALEFHHLDKNTKEFNIARLKETAINNKIKKELEKCILVCANCHREIHNEMLQ